MPFSSLAASIGGDDGVEVVPVLHPLDVPAVRRRNRAARSSVKARLVLALDGDVVVGVQDDQLAEPQVARQGSGLRGDALHQVPVTGQDVCVVVNDAVARPVEAGRQG